jgi:hypothetical protein
MQRDPGPQIRGPRISCVGPHRRVACATGVPDTAQAAFGFPTFNERHPPISKQVEEKTVNALENLNDQ